MRLWPKQYDHLVYVDTIVMKFSITPLEFVCTTYRFYRLKNPINVALISIIDI